MHSLYKNWLAAATLVAAVTLSGGRLRAEPTNAGAPSSGSAGTINGAVLDPSGAVVPNATIEIHNPVTDFERKTATDAKGAFTFVNVPFNNYHMTVTAEGFATSAQDVEVRSVVPVIAQVNLQVVASATTVSVEAAGDLVENDPTSMPTWTNS